MYRRSLLSITSSVALISLVLVQPDTARGQTSGIAFESETRIPDQVCAVGDLNSDGFADLVSTGWPDAAVHVRFNDGHGFFASAQSLAIPSYSGSVAVADIDGDGHLDILASVPTPAGVMVFLNDPAGTGQFVPHFVPTSLSATYGGWVFVGDLDGDGRTDALILDVYHSMAAVIPNSQVGALSATVFPLHVPSFGGIALADVDLDGDLDLVCGDWGDNKIDVFLNNGFASYLPAASIPCAFPVQTLTCGDLDGDGYPDVLAGPATYGLPLQVFRNLGNGTFATPFPLPQSNSYYCLRISDVDADGLNDIEAGGGGVLAVFRGMGGGAFARADLYSIDFVVNSIDLAQLDADGHVDMVCAAYGGTNPGYVQTFLSKSGGKFSSLPFFSMGSYPSHTRVVDVDGDGDLDVITLLDYGPLSVVRNRGDGTFDDPAHYPGYNYPKGMASSDIDGDGDQDVVISSTYGGGSIFVYLNQGNGVFALPLRFPAPSNVSIALADMDGDGSVDVILGVQNAGEISIMHQLQPMQFVFDQSLHLNHSSAQLEVADLDGDGDVELLAGALSGWPTGLSVFTNLGQGQFSLPVQVSSGNVGKFACADIDGDGISDLVTTYPDRIGVRISRGDGTFRPETSYQAGHNQSDLVCADFDGDLRIDVIVSDTGRRELDVFKNAGHGRLRRGVRIPSSGDSETAAGDLDGDGDADLVLTNWSMSGFFVQRNLATNGSAFCFGDGSGTACPCGNQSASGTNSGCLNSLGLGGQLSGGGHAELHADSVVLTCSQLHNGAALLFQSPAVVGGGAGGVFMDGLRCVGSPVIRLGVHIINSGMTVFPAPGEPKLATAGGIQSPGDMHYQVWYRDPASFCTPYTANLTNGWTVHWAP